MQVIEPVVKAKSEWRRRGGRHLAELIRTGYVQALLTGNALPVHDIETNLFGTSLGVDLNRGVGVQGGHRHHLNAINRIRAAGSIETTVGPASVSLRTAPTSDAIFDGFLGRTRDAPHSSAVSSDGVVPQEPSFRVVPVHIVRVQGLSSIRRCRCFLVDPSADRC